MKRLLIIGSMICALAYIGADLNLHLRAAKTTCETARDGVWSANHARCILESCYAEGTCGGRAYPAAHCGKLAIGDPVGRVALHLGDPVTDRDGHLTWYEHKALSGIGVRARVRDGILIGLDCPAYPDPLQSAPRGPDPDRP